MRIAIVRYIRNPDNYFFDILDATAAGTLKKHGHSVAVVERIRASGFDETDLLRGLADFVADFLPELVVLSYLPTVRLAGALKQRTHARIVAVGSRLLLSCPDVDFVLRELDPLSLLDLVEALGHGTDLSRVPALAWRPEAARLAVVDTTDGDGAGISDLRSQVSDHERATDRGGAGVSDLRSQISSRQEQMDMGGIVVSGGALHPIWEIFTAGAIDYGAFYRIGPGKPPEVRKHLIADWGCPYRNAPVPTGDPAQECKGLIASGVPATGCLFCARPFWSPVEWDTRAEVLSVQLDAVLAGFPETRKLILIDESGLSYLDSFAKLLVGKPSEGIDVLVSGRLDHVNRYIGPLKTALGILSGRNTIRLYQFGIENLSDTVLRRYNKGLDYPAVRDNCQRILELVGQYPGLEIERSFGFILFDPWTTARELAENLERQEEVKLQRFRADAPYTSLRLQPEVPLYFRALEEGLLDPALGDDEFGYSAGAGWRFKHPEVARIFGRLRALRGAGSAWECLRRAMSD